jgi:glucosamine-6-phosphate deaminase
MVEQAKVLTVDTVKVNIFADKATVGEKAAQFVADKVKAIVEKHGSARVIFATGASQFEFIQSLVLIKDIPWDKVTAFHLDEYFDLEGGDKHSASFRNYLNVRLFSQLSPQIPVVNYLDPAHMEEYG